MNKLHLIALTLVFTSFSAYGAETVSAPVKPVQPISATAVSTSSKSPISQQDKMRECSKQATGKKGAERKAFMKTCLSNKPKA